MKYFIVLFLFALTACSTAPKEYRTRIDLQGPWQFALDTANVGETQQWFLSGLKDTVSLPGTTDLNHKGFLNTDTTTMHLNRLYKYEGIAWYRREITIPEDFTNKHLQLVLERTKCTKVWVDSILVGGSHLLQSPQQFDVSDVLTPGQHRITVQVNNDLKLTPYGNVHIYSDDTQTNWNGIIGQLYIEASAPSYISNLQVYPNVEKRAIQVEVDIENPAQLKEFDVELIVEKTVDGKTTRLKPQQFKLAYQPKLQLDYSLAGDCDLWDEYHQPLYRLTATLINGDNKDSRTVPFGIRKFAAKGTQFAINGRTVFLRGKHEAAVFPLTGCTPTDVADWTRVFRIAKSYGINHYRFHSYCPPEAAFTAADQEGIYIQAELPFWGGLESDTIAEALKAEGLAMQKAYANHSSFVLFSPGNEIWSGHDRVEKMMLNLKAADKRLLYAMGSNNNVGYTPPRDYCDYFIGARIPENGDSIIGHTRLTHAYADAREGGILNTQTPSTNFDFEYAVSHLSIPIISHEIGQYQIYPNYKEIDKYTGVLKAWNLEVFREGLEKSGMGNMDAIFQQASGAWAALCYKAEMEAALRTKGMGGFQLLDLQDFPGQGTALVGILDAFMDSKGVVTPEDWKQSCNDVVLLLEFPKYCWTSGENYQAKLLVANYSDKAINGTLNWEITKQDGSVFAKGSFEDLKIENGGLFSAGELNESLSSITQAERLNIRVSIPNTEYANSYPIWVYPPATHVENTSDVLVAEKLDKQVMAKLESGGKVLLFPQSAEVKNNSFEGHFPPEFWNYGMFKTISEDVHKPVSPGTLGILTNPNHPLFRSFATDFHTNWQWFSIIKASNSLILDGTTPRFVPIVQVIDNLERNHKLGLIFEFKVGKGKLLVCMSQLNQLSDKPEAVQLYRSILDYMNSKDFNPSYPMEPNELKALL